MGLASAKTNLVRLAQDPESMDMIEALYWVAVAMGEDVGGEPLHEEFELLSAPLRPLLEGREGVEDRVDILTHYLVQECGFRGNMKDFYNTSNSHLHQVLKTRVGIPISLSIVYIEVARRVGIDLAGVSFPYHFLVCVCDLDDLYLDPFDGGSKLDEQGCRKMLARLSGNKLDFRGRFIKPIWPLELLIRVLRNFKLLHLRHQEYKAACGDMDLVLALAPGAAVEHRDRGQVRMHMRLWNDAIFDFEQYLALRPNASDRLKVEVNIQQARAQYLKMN